MCRGRKPQGHAPAWGRERDEFSEAALLKLSRKAASTQLHHCQCALWWLGLKHRGAPQTQDPSLTLWQPRLHRQTH